MSDNTLLPLGQRARAAWRQLALSSDAQRVACLQELAARLRAEQAVVLEANARDMAAASEAGMSPAMQDRLRLDDKRMEAIASQVEEIAAMPDPLGEVLESRVRGNGLKVERVTVALGVIAMVYEARPNVTIDAAALAIRSGNAILLKGGSEALHSNKALAALVSASLRACHLPEHVCQLVERTDREVVRDLVRLSGLVDLAIPRGGEGLIRFVTDNATVPVVQHYKGVCHTFLEASADKSAATEILLNAKLQRPSVCNATECLLIDDGAPLDTVKTVLVALLDAGCEIRGCPTTRTVDSRILAATDDDWGAEYGAPILAAKVVEGLDGALAHIARFGSGHTEAILTKNEDFAARFVRQADAACVVVNASTRFHDGGELGLGAEMGIATSRMHWRGPMGVRSLTTMKWVVRGNGHCRK